MVPTNHPSIFVVKQREDSTPKSERVIGFSKKDVDKPQKDEERPSAISQRVWKVTEHTQRIIPRSGPMYPFESPEVLHKNAREAREAAYKLHKQVCKSSELEAPSREKFFCGVRKQTEEETAAGNRLHIADYPVPQQPDRTFIVDSGASNHIVCRDDIYAKELKTLRPLQEPIYMQTANGLIVVEEEVKVFVSTLQISVWANVLENTPNLLSLGCLCEKEGYSYHWSFGKTPYIQKGDGQKHFCVRKNNVPIIAPGQSVDKVRGRKHSRASSSKDIPEVSAEPTPVEIIADEEKPVETDEDEKGPESEPFFFVGL